jgi:hypothetical protein
VPEDSPSGGPLLAGAIRMSIRRFAMARFAVISESTLGARPLPHQTPDILPTFLFLRQSTNVASPLLRRAVSCLF